MRACVKSLLFVFVVQICFRNISATICPEGWSYFHPHCYRIHGSDNDLRTWSDASRECRHEGGQLAVVDDTSVQEFMEKQILAHGSKISPVIKRRQFWVENYRYNQRLQSHASGKSLCPQLNFYDFPGVSSLFWKTAVCESRSNFICQARPVNAARDEDVRLKCDPPFVEHIGACYWVSNDFANWDAARKACYQKRSSLVRIENEEENEYLKDQISRDTWIGYRLIRPDQSISDASFLQYADGTNVSESDYENRWQQVENLGPASFCYIMDTTYERGKWLAHSCTEQKPFICSHHGELLPQKPDPGYFYPECGEDWVLIGDKCYKINLELVNFGLAAQVCQNEAHDSQVLYITSPEEERDVIALINGKRNMTSPLMTVDASYWTGLQISRPNQWQWTSRNQREWDLPVAYSNFAPDADFKSATNYNPFCVSLSSSGGGWLPKNCTGLRYPVCKRPANITQKPPSTTLPLPFDFTYGCPKGWEHHDANCFQRNDTYLDWSSAQKACREQKGYLASITAQSQIDQLSDTFKDAWIGLNSKGSPVDPRLYRNDDGSPVVFTPWANQISRPNDFVANCVAAQQQRPALRLTIETHSCDTTRSFVCMLPEVEMELLPPECVTPPQDIGCRRWGYGYKDSCLYMGNDASNPSGQREIVTFEDARATCRKHFDADLVVINQADKQEFIAHLIGQWGSDYWIGLKEDEMPWNAFKKWVTGENVEYTNWAHSEPHVSQENLGCVALIAARGDLHNPGEWYVNPCSSYKFALCEGKRHGWTPPTPAPTAYANGCPKNWGTPDVLSRNCYKMFDPTVSTASGQSVFRNLTWDEAEIFCIGYRGHLASIDSASEQEFVRRLLPYAQNQHKDTFWIGLKENEHLWPEWSDGTEYGTHTQFHPSVHHGSSDTTDCVAIESVTGLWIEQNCLLSRGWICEVPKGFYTEGEELPALPLTIGANLTCGSHSGRGKWYYHAESDSCFFVSGFQDTWRNAQDFCRSIQSHLATIELTQHDFLTMLISKLGPVDTQFWIGLRLRNPLTNQHVWIDGSNSHFRAWAQGEPHPYGVEACVTMDNRNGRWRDEVCGVSFEFVCRKSKTPVAATMKPLPSAVTDSWGCPTNCTSCVPFRDSCYYFSSPNHQVDWVSAHMSCGQIYINEDHTKRSHLLSIHDTLEQSLIVSQMGQDRMNRWMGLFEDRKKNGWFYTDDTLFDYTNWDFKEPVPYPQESLCVYVLGDAGRAGTWNDHFCSDKYPYICKMKKDPQFPVATPPSPKCPNGFSGTGDACFKVVAVTTGSANWANAVSECSRESGARIATIVNIYENAQIHVLLAEKVKFVNDSMAEAWIGVIETKGSLSWPISGCLPTYNNIREFYSETTTDGMTCGALSYDGTWHTSPCSANKNYAVCEIRKQECAKDPEPVNGTCPNGADIDCGGTFCYQVQLPNSTSSKSYSWYQAKIACEAMDGNLVSVRNEEENSCLQRWVESSTGAWIGLTEEPVGSGWPLQYEWKWVDPEVPLGTFRNWAPGKPSGGNNLREPCAEMGNDGKWYSRLCDGNHQHPRGYICEVKKVHLPNETCGTSSEKGDWFYHSASDSCFFISKTQESWHKSQRSCNALAAQLATVDGASHQDFLTTVLAKKSQGKGQFWIGLRLRNPATNQHAWVDGSNSHFRAWAPGEPHPYGVEACVTMDSRDGKWRDEVCGVKFEFICKKSRLPAGITTATPPPSTESYKWGCPASCPTCVPFRDSCYYFSSEHNTTNWNYAHQNCTSLIGNEQDPSKRAHLLSIHDDLEQSFVVAQMGKDRVSRWMGLFEDRMKNGWFYTDETPFDYTNWDFNEPILYPQEPLCVYIIGEAGRAGTWNDHFCRDEHAYICKMKKDPQFPATPPPSGNCPDGFFGVAGACFKVMALSDGHGTWDDARSACSREPGVRIATVTDVYENAQIHILLAEMINFVNASTSQAWIGLLETEGRIHWPASKCLPVFNNIQGFYSEPTFEGYTCGAISYDGTWHTNQCRSNKKYVVCEKREPECPQHPEPVNGFCPEGTSVDCGGNFCYKVQLPTDAKNYTWTEAKDSCEAISGSLASIRNEEENNCLHQFVQHSTGAWIGLVEEQVDMFGSRYEWTWMDPDVYIGNFKNWAPGKPSHNNWPRHACVEMRNDGKWVNMACSGYVQHPRGYICEAKKILTASTTAATTQTSSSSFSAISLSTTTTARSMITSTSASRTSTTLPTKTTAYSTTAAGTTTPATISSTRTEEFNGEVSTSTGSPFSGGISAGGLVGVGIAIFVVVCVSTVLGFLLWRRKMTGTPMFGRAGGSVDSEEMPVVRHIHEEYDTYT